VINNDSLQNNSITCVLMNVQSLVNKIYLLNEIIDNSKPDIIALTETWMKEDNVTDQMISGNGLYEVYRVDRDHKIGGGVCLLVNKKYNSSQVILNNRANKASNCEMLSGFVYKCELSPYNLLSPTRICANQ
jgi:exonuclease III